MVVCHLDTTKKRLINAAVYVAVLLVASSCAPGQREQGSLVSEPVGGAVASGSTLALRNHSLLPKVPATKESATSVA